MGDPKTGLEALLTPDNCMLMLIDHQPFQFAGLRSHDTQTIINNVVGLAKSAKVFGVPTLLTTVVERAGRLLIKQLQELFPEQKPIDRTFINTWEDARVVDWVKKTGRKKIVMAALWTEICLAMPAIQALGEGYEAFIVTDASGGVTVEAHEMGHPADGSGWRRAYHMDGPWLRSSSGTGPVRQPYPDYAQMLAIHFGRRRHQLSVGAAAAQFAFRGQEAGRSLGAFGQGSRRSHEHRHHWRGRHRPGFRGPRGKSGLSEVIVSNSRGPESLVDVVSRLGPRVRAGTRQEAAQADVVFVSVGWEQVRAALADLPGLGRSYPYRRHQPRSPAGLSPRGAARQRIERDRGIDGPPAPGSSRLPTPCSGTCLRAEPKQNGGRRVLFMSGDDRDAKGQVSAILEKAGFATIDLGGLASGGKLQQFPGGPLPTLNLIKLG